MKLTRLGKAGVQVSRLCLGTMSMGAQQWRPWVLGEAEARPLFQRAVELGVNFFDTADTYSAGEAEMLLGKLVRETGRRDEFVITTKVYNPVTFDFKSGQDLASLEKARKPNMQGLSRKRIFAAIDASLQRLQLDHVDLYQIHRWDYAVEVEEFMEALHDVVKAGKARYIGASSMWAWQFAKAQHVAERHGWTKFVSMQNHYNLAYREEEREMLPMLRDMGVACIPWSPLARGFLLEEPGAPSSSVRRDVDPLRKQYYSGESDRAVAAAVGEVAKERGVTRGQVVMAWLLSPHSASGGVTAPIVGPQTIAELEDLAAGTELQLSPDEVRRLEAPYQPKRVMGHQ
ncbi:1-deoxyxylulose-5-phosphate synthase YajO [Usitatibacter rugosus]|uniref:1-deoxyxylulose-5-phosphate synthase YajO n=1 Tax=Usitatibacter rugosus TaxID=2732067 RepID=A0A6M4H098_9PROT|nr:aldo/keto reductase [Usitatibacter rugosus]QJR12083.1 1-deoxyxylulose-5-phosphate synthase YajO [Usitatibacter rugosus]